MVSTLPYTLHLGVEGSPDQEHCNRMRDAGVWSPHRSWVALELLLLGDMESRGDGRVTSLCALRSELAERQQETKALLWELERGASSCPLQPRDLDVVREKLHKSPFRELAEKDVPSVGRVHTPEHRFAGELGAGSGFCPPSSPSTPQDALW